jgi:DNA adenine methylase
MVVKPIIKWVGGKTQILETLEEKFINLVKDKPLESYYEIFLGGGSVLLGILSWIKEGKIKVSNSFKVKAYDINSSLIHMFINIRDNPQEIYDIILPLIEYFKIVDDKSKESYYYQLRDYYNKEFHNHNERKKTSTASALFIFLNKTGFRGLYREGPRGYNVPYGHYKNPEILNYEHLMEISRLIENVNFEVLNFSESLEKIIDIHHNKENSHLVYLDPPYVPLTSKSFTKYNESDFSLENHNKLFDLCHRLPISFIMSNSDTKLVKEAFGFEKENVSDKLNNKYSIELIECKRSINSKNPGEKAMEVFIEFKIL